MYIYRQLDIEIERKSERERERERYTETELGDHEIHNTEEAILTLSVGSKAPD